MNSKSDEIQRQKPLLNWLTFLLHADTMTEEEIAELIKETPGIEVAYNKYKEFFSNPELREFALARAKMERDHQGPTDNAEDGSED